MNYTSDPTLKQTARATLHLEKQKPRRLVEKKLGSKGPKNVPIWYECNVLIKLDSVK